MSKLITTKPDVSSENEKCPNCGSEYTIFEYYKGRSVSEPGQEKRYEDFSKHTGGICEACYRKSLKNYIPIFLLVALIGIALFVFLIILPISGDSSYFDTKDIEFLGIFKLTMFNSILPCLGFMGIGAVVVGFFGVFVSLSKPKSNGKNGASYASFFKRLRKEHDNTPGRVYLTPNDAADLGLTKNDK